MSADTCRIHDDRARSLLLYATNIFDTGKTHLAIALGVEVTKQERRVLFIRAV